MGRRANPQRADQDEHAQHANRARRRRHAVAAGQDERSDPPGDDEHQERGEDQDGVASAAGSIVAIGSWRAGIRDAAGYERYAWQSGGVTSRVHATTSPATVHGQLIRRGPPRGRRPEWSLRSGAPGISGSVGARSGAAKGARPHDVEPSRFIAMARRSRLAAGRERSQGSSTPLQIQLGRPSIRDLEGPVLPHWSGFQHRGRRRTFACAKSRVLRTPCRGGNVDQRRRTNGVLTRTANSCDGRSHVLGGATVLTGAAGRASDRAVILTFELSGPADRASAVAACVAVDAIGYLASATQVTAWVRADAVPAILRDQRTDKLRLRISLPPTTTLTPDEINVIREVLGADGVELTAAVNQGDPESA